MASQGNPYTTMPADQWWPIDRAFTAVAAAVRIADMRQAALDRAGLKRSDFTDEQWDKVAADFGC